MLVKMTVELLVATMADRTVELLVVLTVVWMVVG